MAIYKHLRRDNSQIRLVHVLAPSPHDTCLSLELRNGYIEAGTYSALSYVWGDTSEQKYILVNRVLFRIRRNLYQALTQLRSNGVIGWLWINSLCIQQKNLDEKSYQVGLMGAIFRHAARVYSWLGEGTPSTDIAMDFCARIGSQATMVGIDQGSGINLGIFLQELFVSRKSASGLTSGAQALAAFFRGLLQDPGLKAQKTGPNQLFQGLRDMMNREYWTRIWINQEVALAKEAVVLCGDKSELLGLIENAITSLELGSFCYQYMPSDIATDIFSMREQTPTNLPLFTRRLHQRGRSIPLWQLLYHDFYMPLPRLYTATDPRDIIFALLGVITDNDKLGIQADYHLSMKEVFTVATRAMYECDADGLELDLCTPDERNQAVLPSWVIDWRRFGIETRRTWPINRSRRWPHYYATGEIDVPTAAFVEGDNQRGILRRYGCFVDEISYVWRYNEGSCDESTPAGRERDKTRRLSSIIEFMQLPQTSGPGEDYVWRTLRYRYSNGSEDAQDEINSFIRAIMRQQIATVDNLTMLQKLHLNSVPAPKPQSKNWTVAEKLSNAIQHVQDCVFVSGEGRTLFKTQKGMLGLGHALIQPGDVVTLLLGCHSPLVLRPRHEGGFNFVGDAYVDGIMQGEFFQTIPTEKEFVIY